MTEIKYVTVLGAGTMGAGIAQVCASAGCRATLFDVDDDALEQGFDRIRRNLDKGLELGKLSSQEHHDSLNRLQGAHDLAFAVERADLVVEAVPEVLELKQRIFREVDAAAPPHAILATNTSSLSIAGISEAVADPSRVVGLHFFNPVHLMKLVEVVWGPRTSDAVRDAATDFVRRLGKEPVVVKDSPGFASSRLGIVLGMEAIRMVEEGVAAPEDIDRAMELGYRHPMGPLRLTDLVGLDVRLGIAQYLHETLGSEAFRPPDLLRRMVEEGKLGKKSGRGFYDWSEG
ncbi:MAG: 3-hydroxyacyl-CoA dehydrogenase family protein [Gemmatimonadales bacterium]|nr:MAG: 3-hydroxyacyl-CoA dehydrogenase family protein [Gemmatimonadales bacterium]